VPWYVDLIEAAGWPDNTITETALQLWASSEGMPPQANNWLAEETAYPTLGALPPVPPYTPPWYSTEAGGVLATLAFLGGSNYDEVRRFFQLGNNLVDIYLAINGSPWCSGCQGGHYPIDLYTEVAPQLAGGGTDIIPTGSETPASLMAGWWSEMEGWVTGGAALVDAAIAEAQAIFEAIQ